MISVIKLKGGLGNQMFQYAFYLSRKKKHPFLFYLFDNEETLYCHDGITLDAVFDVSVAEKAKWYRRLKRTLLSKKSVLHIVEQENSLQYDKRYLNTNGVISLFDGYWQSEKYFNQIADKIHRAFQFKEKELNDKTLSFKNELQRGVFVSVHIRRGDYLNNVGRFGLCELSYYREAIKYIKSIVDNPKFVFFSDDMAWAKDNIDNDEAVFVSWNQGKDSWQDMYLMSHCQHNIVANSSFSWWGAWLNGNPHKVVVAPKKWFMYSPNYDIIPDNWITI